MSFSDSVSRNLAALALTAPAGVQQRDVDDLWGEYHRQIITLCRTAHLVFTTLPWPSVGPRLSERQKEVLQWVADGKTAAEIAVILGLKPATIEKHLKMARQALNVETTAQAIMKVSVYKQIFALEPRVSAG